MIPLHIKASEPGFDEINELASQIAILKNTHMWFNLQEDFKTLPEEERLAMISTLEAEMQELIS